MRFACSQELGELALSQFGHSVCLDFCDWLTARITIPSTDRVCRRFTHAQNNQNQSIYFFTIYYFSRASLGVLPMPWSGNKRRYTHNCTSNSGNKTHICYGYFD